MVFLTKSQILVSHTELINDIRGINGFINESSLDYALDIIESSIFGVDEYPSIEDKACKLCFSIINGHCFVDGNKRTGEYCLTTFLEMNTVKLNLSKEEIVKLMNSIADNSITYEKFVEIIKEHTLPITLT